MEKVRFDWTKLVPTLVITPEVVQKLKKTAKLSGSINLFLYGNYSKNDTDLNPVIEVVDSSKPFTDDEYNEEIQKIPNDKILIGISSPFSWYPQDYISEFVQQFENMQSCGNNIYQIFGVIGPNDKTGLNLKILCCLPEAAGVATLLKSGVKKKRKQAHSSTSQYVILKTGESHIDAEFYGISGINDPMVFSLAYSLTVKYNRPIHANIDGKIFEIKMKIANKYNQFTSKIATQGNKMIVNFKLQSTFTPKIFEEEEDDDDEYIFIGFEDQEVEEEEEEEIIENAPIQNHGSIESKVETLQRQIQEQSKLIETMNAKINDLTEANTKLMNMYEKDHEELIELLNTILTNVQISQESGANRYILPKRIAKSRPKKAITSTDKHSSIISDKEPGEENDQIKTPLSKPISIDPAPKVEASAKKTQNTSISSTSSKSKEKKRETPKRTIDTKKYSSLNPEEDIFIPEQKHKPHKEQKTEKAPSSSLKFLDSQNFDPSSSVFDKTDIRPKPADSNISPYQSPKKSNFDESSLKNQGNSVAFAYDSEQSLETKALYSKLGINC